jgi:hypothetical protein
MCGVTWRGIVVGTLILLSAAIIKADTVLEWNIVALKTTAASPFNLNRAVSQSFMRRCLTLRVGWNPLACLQCAWQASRSTGRELRRSPFPETEE